MHQTSNLLIKLNLFMSSYVDARSKSKFSKDHEISILFRSVCDEISSLDFLRIRPSVKIVGSIGRGSWAHIPWIALLDERETVSISKGVYPIFFFS